MASSTKIYDTPEYALSSAEMKSFAFSHPDNYISAAAAAERMGVSIKDRSIHALANTGEMIEVPVDVTMYDITPSKNIKIVQATVSGSKQPALLIKGSAPTVKSAIWVTLDNFKNSDEFKQLKQQINDAYRAFKDQLFDQLLTRLRSSLPPAARQAVQDVAQLASAAGAASWFKKKGFDMGAITADNLKNFSHAVATTGTIPSQFKISEQQKYGHAEGTECTIDFEKKKFHISGWSSSD